MLFIDGAPELLFHVAEWLALLRPRSAHRLKPKALPQRSSPPGQMLSQGRPTVDEAKPDGWLGILSLKTYAVQ
jgi:hypothetical protein